LFFTLTKKDLLPCKVSIDQYKNKIPKEMDYNRLKRVNIELFGVDTLEIYKERNLKEINSILISDFSSDGFFWAQIEDEIKSDECQIIFDMINSHEGTQLADLSKKWCIAKFDNEWFRAYIEEIQEDGKLKVFFVDYGTTSIVSHEDTRQYDDEDLWSVAPMAVPCVLRNLAKIKLNSFKNLQYGICNVTSIGLIEGVS
jgi:hypothetical protein